MGWRRIKVEDERRYLVTCYHQKLSSMKDLCEECGVSRQTGYKWYRRFLESGEKGLSDLSRAPHNPNTIYDKRQITTVLDLKLKYPKYGPIKINAMLKKKYPEQCWPSPTRLYEIFKEHHLVSSRKLKRRVPRTQPLGDVNSSNDVWCVDFKGWFNTGDGTKVEPLTITDAYSRFLINCIHLERKRSEDVWKIYTKAFLDYGLPLRVRTDNGPPFATTGAGRLSKLAVQLIKVGVTPEWINPGHPEENGRHERFHRSLKDAIANPVSETFTEQLSRMRSFQDEYNYDRPHEALGLEVPASCYSPSTRDWDGKLRSPEYDDAKMQVRKVVSSGCIHWKGMETYVSQVICGEYVGLEAVDDGKYHVFYGPVFLGTLIERDGFYKPRLKKRKPRMNVNHVGE